LGELGFPSQSYHLQNEPEKKRKKPTPTHRFILDSSMMYTHLGTNSAKIWCTFIKSHHCEILRWVSKSSTASSSSSAGPAKKQQAPCTTTLPVKTSVPFLLLRRHHHRQKKNLLQRYKLHKIAPVHHRLVAATTTTITQQRKNGMKIAPGPPTFNKPKNSEITQELNLQPKKKKKLGSRKNKQEKKKSLKESTRRMGS
jgi:hypothetical protein